MTNQPNGKTLNNQTSVENNKSQWPIPKSIVCWKEAGKWEPGDLRTCPLSESCCPLAVWLQIRHFTSPNLIFSCAKKRFHCRISRWDFQMRNTVFAFINKLPVLYPKHLCWKVVSFWLKATSIQSSSFCTQNLSQSSILLAPATCPVWLMDPGFSNYAMKENIMRKVCVESWGERVSHSWHFLF